MNELFKLFLSLSIAGSILALVLFPLKSLFKDKISKTWQYYIWLIVVVRLLLPYTPKSSIVGELFRQSQNYITIQNKIQTFSSLTTFPSLNAAEKSKSQALSIDKNEIAPKQKAINYWNSLKNNIGLLWFGIAMLILVQKITSYRSYIMFVNAGNRIVTQSTLDTYITICTDLGVKKPLGLYSNSLIISPMLIGIFHPIIVLPDSKVEKQDLYNIILHELTHYKRWDILYKWMTQIVVCLHWFNPLVYFISKEINKNCELSCDENVIKKLDVEGKRQYGNTLLASVRVHRTYGNTIASLTLNEDAKLLKERLDAIMKFRKKSKLVVALTIALTLIMCFGGTFIGAYAASPNTEKTSVNNEISKKSDVAVMKTAAIGKLKFYLVEDEKDLRAIGTGIYSLSDNYMLDGDITLTKEWIAIGNDATPFTGSFDGNGFTINNLVITDKNAEYIGLFGFVEGGTIHNVTLSNVDISKAGGKGRHVGPIAAISLDSHISDCRIK